MTQVPEAWVELAPIDVAKKPPDHPYRFEGYESGGMGRLYMAHERIGPAFRELYKQIMFEPGELSRTEKEMVAAVAAAAQDCFY